MVDGEAVWAGKDGKSDFDRLHSRTHDDAVFLYAFDLLELNGEDYREHPLEKRKAKLEKILARTQGMRFSMGPRNQARWLPADCSLGWQSGQAIHPSRLRLVGQVSFGYLRLCARFGSVQSSWTGKRLAWVGEQVGFR
jgi:hypothetical protein